MDFRNILQSLNTISEGDVSHKGTYGTSYGKEDVRDQYGHKIGKVDKGAEGKKEEPKRGRGRPTKGDKDEHGHSTKFDTSGLQGMLGSKSKGEVGKKSVKHSLKEYIEEVETNQQLDEAPTRDRGLDLQPLEGGAGGGGAGGAGPKWTPTRIPGVKTHEGPPPTVTPAGSTPKLPANYEQPAISRVTNNTQIEKEFGNFLKGQSGQTFGTPSAGAGRGSQGVPTASQATSRTTSSNPKSGNLDNVRPGVGTDLGRMGNERPGSRGVLDPAFDLPRGPGSGLDEADDFGPGPGYPLDNQAGPIGAGPERIPNTGVPDVKNYKAPLTDKYGTKPGSHAGGWDAAGQQKYIDRTAPSIVNKIKDKLGLDMPDPDHGPRPDERERLVKRYPKPTNEGKKDLPGNQDELDVAPPKGKLTSADFKALSNKKKVKESKIMSIVESINFKELMANADADVQEMLMELQNDVEMFKETGQSSELLDSFLKVHLHKKKKITDEAMFDEEASAGAGRGFVNPPVVNPNTPAPAARTASPGWGKDDYKPLVPDTSTTFKPAVTDPEGVKEAGSFIRGLASSRKTFEGKEMKDVQLESWEKELNNLLNEGITVSTSTGQQGAPDSVSINATDNDANELLNILRQSGMGVFGGNEKPAMTPYGVISQGEEEPTGTGTEPEMSPEVVGDGDDMLSLIKKMSGLSAGPVGQEPEGAASSDYEDEEGAEEVDEQYLSEPIVAKPSPDNTNPPSTPAPPPATPGSDGTNEDEVEEGAGVMHFKAQQAKADGKKSFKLGDKEYPVKEGHDHEECNECGYAMESCECDQEEQVEEGFSNDAGGDAMANTELAKLKALLSMGGDLHKMKRDQTVGNPTQVSMAESLAQWKRLSGIK